MPSNSQTCKGSRVRFGPDPLPSTGSVPLLREVDRRLSRTTPTNRAVSSAQTVRSPPLRGGLFLWDRGFVNEAGPSLRENDAMARPSRTRGSRRPACSRGLTVCETRAMTAGRRNRLP